MLISDGVIDIGVDSTRFVPGDTDALLRSYLMMVRRTRNQRRAVSITLRRDDIEAIADHLGQTAATVLARLADLMGSTKTQRTAMLTLFATGAMLIAVTGSVAAEAPPWAASVAGDAAQPVTLDLGASYPADDSTLFGPAALPAHLPVHAYGAAGDTGPSRPGAQIDDLENAAGVATERLATSSEGADPDAQEPSDSDQVGVIAGDDGEPVLVAVGTPPAPPQFADTVDTSPTQFAESVEVLDPPLIAAPEFVQVLGPPLETLDPEHVVEPEEIDVTEDGSTVAVGLPPVPPPPASAD